MRFLKSIGFLIVISAISYGGYMAYNNWYGSATKEKTSQALELLSGDVKGTVSEKVQTYAEAAKESVLQSVGKYAATLVGETLSSIGNIIMQTGVSVSGNRSGDDSLLDVSSDIALSVTVGTPLSFLLPPDIAYTIQWGDGAEEDGNTPPKEALVQSHAWDKEGVHQVLITSIQSGVREEYHYIVDVRNAP